MFRDLSMAEITRRLLAAAMESPGIQTAPLANFSGNLTVVSGLSGDIVGMERTSTCSLTMGSVSYMLSLPSFTYTIDGPETPNYDQILHNEAQLRTNGGNFAAGCGDPVVGIPARKALYIGLTKGGFKVYGDAFYDGTTGANDVETLVANASTDAAVSSDLITSLPNRSFALRGPQRRWESGSGGAERRAQLRGRNRVGVVGGCEWGWRFRRAYQLQSARPLDRQRRH